MRKYLLWLSLILLVWCASAVAGERRFAIMFHTRSCSPCQQMLSNVVPVLQAKGLGIFPMDITGEDVPGVSFVPTTWIYDGDTRKGIKKFVGFTSAETIESWLSPQEQATTATTLTRPRFVSTQWGYIDLENYSRPGCNCAMCRGIRALQAQYWASSRAVVFTSAVQPAQEPTPPDVSKDLLDSLQLKSSDVYCDLGCGDGHLLIAAVRRSGCTAIGVEIDPAMVAKARRSVADAGLSNKILIIEGDAEDFSLGEWGVTKVTAYLYPDLLNKLAAKLAQAEIAASPFHPVAGLSGEQVGDIWVYHGG